MKKIICVVIIFTYVTILSGCGNDTNLKFYSFLSNESITEQDSTVNDNSLFSDYENNDSHSNGTSLILSNNLAYVNSFSEDYAWAFFDENNTTVLGCFDKKGNIIYKTYDSIITADAVHGYSEDFCYIFSGQKGSDGFSYNNLKVSVVDKNGDIRGTYSYCHQDNENYKYLSEYGELCVAFGGGCTVIQKYVSDFNSNYYEYTILDENKNKKASISFDSIPKIKYAGKGAFAFMKNDNTKYYFIDSEKWVDFDDYIDISFYCNYQIYHKSTEYVSIVDTQGTKQEIDLSGHFNGNISVSEVHDDKFIVKSGGASYGNLEIGVYDISTKALTKLNNYLDKIDEDNILKNYFVDNRIIVKLIGSDGQKYYSLMDEKLNTITEPTKVNSIPQINCERIVIDRKVYDNNGNFVFSVDSKFSNIRTVATCFTDNCLRVARTEGNTEYIDYIDKDGNLLFEISNGIFYDNQSKIITLK